MHCIDKRTQKMYYKLVYPFQRGSLTLLKILVFLYSQITRITVL